MNLRKVRTVAEFELVSTLKRPAYLITTFGMPVFVLLYAGFGLLIAGTMNTAESKPRVYGIVDPSNVLHLEQDTVASSLPVPAELDAALESTGMGEIIDQASDGQARSTFRPFANEDAARAAIADAAIAAYYRIDADYMATGRVDATFAPDASWKENGARGALERMFRERLLADSQEPALAARIARPIAVSESFTFEIDGQEVARTMGGQIAGAVIPIGFAVLLFMALAMSTSYLIQGTAAEKENKVVDVLLAAAGPDEILTGKLLGLGIAGLLQITVWFGMILVAGTLFAATIASFGVELPWLALAVAPLFFAAAYFFVGSLILGTGSLGKNLKEVQQFGMVWSLLSAVPMMFMGVLITDPNGTLGQVLTWIPFSAPVTIVLRLALEPEGVPTWQVAGSLAMMVVSTWIALKLGARLFRVGLLLTGTRPKLRALLRQARLGI